MQESRLLVNDGTVPGGGQQTLSAFADRLLKECKMKVFKITFTQHTALFFAKV